MGAVLTAGVEEETVEVQEGHEKLVEQGAYLAKGAVEVQMGELAIEDGQTAATSTSSATTATNTVKTSGDNVLGIETGEIELDGDESDALFDAIPLKAQWMLWI